MQVSQYIFGNIKWYAFLIVLGIILAIILASSQEKRLQLPKDTAVDLALILLPAGVIGARLYYVLFSFDYFAGHPLEIFAVWNGGLAIYGAIIGGFLSVFLYAKRKQLRPLTLVDMIVPGLALAQSIGRWGNFFNGEAYGYAVTNPLLCRFPLAVLIGGEYHLATFFYESAWDLAVFLVLWFYVRRTARSSGQTTAWYLLLYGAGRMVIEGLRTDSLMLGPIRISQLLSAILCIVALWCFAKSIQSRAVVIGLAAVALITLILHNTWLILMTSVILIAAGFCFYHTRRKENEPCRPLG